MYPWKKLSAEQKLFWLSSFFSVLLNYDSYFQGCYYTLVDWIEDNAWILIGVALGIAAFEVYGFWK